MFSQIRRLFKIKLSPGFIISAYVVFLIVSFEVKKWFIHYIYSSNISIVNPVSLLNQVDLACKT